MWSNAPTFIVESDIVNFLRAKGTFSSFPAVLGEHYFVPNPINATAGLSPKWDFTSKAFAGNTAAFVTAKGADDIPSPLGGENVDWLYLTNVQGGLAQEVYRTDTTGGQPPAEVSINRWRRHIY